MVGAVFGSAVFYTSKALSPGAFSGDLHDTGTVVTVRRLVEQSPSLVYDYIMSTMCGSVAGMVMVGAYFYALKSFPERVIPATLWAMPLLFVILTTGFLAAGMYMITASDPDIAMPYFACAGVCAFSLCCFACSAWMWSSMVPFTVQVVKAVMEVVTQHPALILVAFIGMGLATMWLVACCVVAASLHRENRLHNKGESDGGHFILIFLFTLVTCWGSMVATNMTVVAYAGVFGRWYYKKEGPMTIPSFRVAATTSFGSVCMGSLLVAVIRAVEAVARKMQEDADNPVACLIACVVRSILSCIGDMIEYFNAWAYIQCAVRNASFTEAASITMSMCTCAHVHLIFADILVGWVAGVGTLLASIVGFVAGFAVGFGLSGGSAEVAGVGGGAAFVAALMIGSIVGNIIGTGTKTILVLWAEDADPLQASHPELHSAFESKVSGKLDNESTTELQQQNAP